MRIRRQIPQRPRRALEHCVYTNACEFMVSHSQTPGAGYIARLGPEGCATTRSLLAIRVLQSFQPALSDSDTLNRHVEIPCGSTDDGDSACQNCRRGHTSVNDSSFNLNRRRLVRQDRSGLALTSSVQAALMKTLLKQWPKMLTSLPWVKLNLVATLSNVS